MYRDSGVQKIVFRREQGREQGREGARFEVGKGHAKRGGKGVGQ